MRNGVRSRPTAAARGGTQAPLLVKAIIAASCGTLLALVGLLVALRSNAHSRKNIFAYNNEDSKIAEEDRLSDTKRRKRTDLTTSVYIWEEKEEEEDEPQLPTIDEVFTTRSSSNNKKPRIAIIIPFIASIDSAPTLPSYFQAFATSAGGSKDLVDFLIFHDGLPSHFIPPPESIPSNVKLINLGSTENMAKLFLRCIDRQDVTRQKQNTLVRILARQLPHYPYVLVEYKPALGEWLKMESRCTQLKFVPYAYVYFDRTACELTCFVSLVCCRNFHFRPYLPRVLDWLLPLGIQ